MSQLSWYPSSNDWKSTYCACGSAPASRARSVQRDAGARGDGRPSLDAEVIELVSGARQGRQIVERELERRANQSADLEVPRAARRRVPHGDVVGDEVRREMLARQPRAARRHVHRRVAQQRALERFVLALGELEQGLCATAGPTSRTPRERARPAAPPLGERESAAGRCPAVPP